jgi:hypothetical protein
MSIECEKYLEERLTVSRKFGRAYSHYGARYSTVSLCTFFLFIYATSPLPDTSGRAC